MKIFISWSGVISEKVSLGLKEWIPCVIQAIKPFVSSEDVRKGSRWLSEISAELDETSFGVLCLTPDNLTAPWLLFEAGALAKRVDAAHVCPLLIGVKQAQVEYPLAQFQFTGSTKGEIEKLLHTINIKLGDNRVNEKILNEAIDLHWPKLERVFAEAIAAITAADAKQPATATRNTDDMIEEILVLTRSMAQNQQAATPGVISSLRELGIASRSNRNLFVDRVADALAADRDRNRLSSLKTIFDANENSSIESDRSNEDKPGNKKKK